MVAPWPRPDPHPPRRARQRRSPPDRRRGGRSRARAAGNTVASVVRRVHVVGGPGSGKTTLARQLAECLGVRAHELDAVAYEGGASRKRTLDERLADAARIAAEPGWVTEGAFVWWTDDLVRAADLVVWLDLPYRVAAWRIVLRHLRADLARRNRHPGYRRLLRFLRGVRGYHRLPAVDPPPAPDDDRALTRAATARYLAPYSDKLVVCHTSGEVAALARRLCADPPVGR